MVFKATFNNISLKILTVSFIDGGNRRTRKKTTDLSQVTDIMSVVHLALIKIRTHNISGDRH